LSLKIAAAPITWGVCEVPGWGHQLDPERVLSEMEALGFSATELGPDGFLPPDPESLRQLLNAHNLMLVAGFVPVVLHQADRWSEERRRTERQMVTLAEGGASIVVLAASTGTEGYERTSSLGDQEWSHLARALAELEEIAARRGLSACLHPHYGTVVETPSQIEGLLQLSDVGICLDTGHVMVGGGDPVELARVAAHRIRHVHLKDVDATVAKAVRKGELSYQQAVAQGLYRPLGQGDVDVAAIVAALDAVGYQGWYVLEQDTVLGEEPPEGMGPRSAAAISLHYLKERLPAA
jgi:inosose dehydratase